MYKRLYYLDMIACDILFEDISDYKETHLDLIMKYHKNNSSVTPSDVNRLISTQPDFYDDESPIEPDALVG